MKKLILIWAAMAISTYSFSQYDSLQNKTKDRMREKKNDSINVNKTCVTITNGKLMVLKQGIMVPMQDAMILQNGTIVMLNGMVKTKEGKVTQMNEGDCLDMSGEMIPIYDSKMQNDGPPKNNK